MGSRTSLGSSSLVSSSSSNDTRPIMIPMKESSFTNSKPQNWSMAKNAPSGYSACPRGCNFFVLNEALRSHSYSKECSIYVEKIQSGAIDPKIKRNKAKKKCSSVRPAFVYGS